MKILFDFAIFITMFSSTIATPCDESQLLTSTGETIGEYCASDEEICEIDGEIKTDGQIRIGDEESNRFSFWRNITSENGFACRIDVYGFGMDPYKDRPRTCQWREGPSASEKKADEAKKRCGTDGNSCSCPMGQARYGYNGGEDAIGERWTNWIDVEDTVMCAWGHDDDNGGFHFDPAHERNKECQCRPTPPPPLTPSQIIKEYQGRWVEIGYGLKQFSVTAGVTVEEGVSETIGEVFAEGYGLSTTVTVGYESSFGASASVSVTAEMSRSYEQSTSYTIHSVDSRTNEVLWDAEVCAGVIYQWEVRAFDRFSKVAASVATAKFVCVPFKPGVGSKVFPSCPETACNFLENCTCCAVEWSDDTDVDQKLCDGVCSYTDGPNADNDGRTCDNWSGTLEEAKSRCTAESTCSYLHDWGDNGTGWRTCSEITVPGDGGAATKTKTCNNRRHLQDEGTVESAFDVSVDTATLSNIKLVGDTSRRHRRLGGTKSAILPA